MEKMMKTVYEIYMDALTNNDGYPIDKLTIDNNNYDLMQSTRHNTLEIMLLVDHNPENDISIVMYDISGNILWKNDIDYKLWLTPR